MPKEYIIAPGIHRPPQWVHAVKVGDVVYTSGITARDGEGNLVGKGDLAAQTEQTFMNLDAVLRAAGATWDDVVKAHFYWPTSEVSGDQWKEHRSIRDRYLPPGQYAGVGACMDLLHPDMLLEVECIAHVAAPKQVVTGVPGVYVPPGWAPAVRAGDTLYIGGQQAIEAEGQGAQAEIPDGEVVAKGDAEAQTRSVYKSHDAILRAAGATWDDLVRVNQYVTQEDGMEPMRAGRSEYLPSATAMSTSVRCGMPHPESIIQVGAEAHLGPRQTFTSPEVWVVPGTCQAAKTGNTIYLQGQIPCGTDGGVLGKGDIAAQAERMFQNSEAMLKAAGATWDDVVHVRGYYERRELLAPVRQVRARYLKDGHYASTGLVAGFFTPHSPDMLLEVEFIAVVG